jgi:AcrR family transcriptional regulator
MDTPAKPTKRLRRPASGGYARGEETRQRIVAAAVKLFGERGFEGASTRDIAAAAGVNAPALQYYFENKEGLYLACAESIVAEVRAQFDPVFKRARAALLAGAGTAALIDALLEIYACMIDGVLLQPRSAERRLFMARELAGEEPAVASKLLQRRLRQPLSKVNMTLMARITGRKLADPENQLRLLTLKGQLMPFYHSPCVALDTLGWKQIDASRAAFVKATLLAQARVLLESWAAAGGKASSR